LTDTPRPERVAELAARFAALQRSARSRGAEPAELLDAALSELEGAVELLQAEAPAEGPVTGGAAGADGVERQLLRAVFTDAPVPLFLVARDGTVQRVNRSAGDLIGAKPGYATGRPFTALVNLPSRAAVQSQLSTVSRTGQSRSVRASLLGQDGLVPGELLIGRVNVRDQADPLVVAVLEAHPARPAPPDEPAPVPGAVQEITGHLDLVTAAARVLLENQGFSESRTLQRCARLIAPSSARWPSWTWSAGTGCAASLPSAPTSRAWPARRAWSRRSTRRPGRSPPGCTNPPMRW